LCALACEDDEPTDLDGSGGSGATGTGGAATGGSGGGATGGNAGTASGGVAGAAGSAGSAGVAGTSGSAGASGAPGDGGGGDAPAACNYLTQVGTAITSTITAGQPPAATGGALTDGFYELTSVKLYGGATGTTFWRTIKIEVGATAFKTVERDGTATLDTTTDGTYSLSGNQLTRNITCPGTSTTSFAYSAPTGKFIAYESQGGTKVVELTYDYDSAI
jgi:hypothetical protein